jgi:hypothetical protein
MGCQSVILELLRLPWNPKLLEFKEMVESCSGPKSGTATKVMQEEHLYLNDFLAMIKKRRALLSPMIEKIVHSCAGYKLTDISASTVIYFFF